MIAVLVTGSLSSAAAGEWAGYYNDKTASKVPYGYLSSNSITRPASKLRLLCHSGGGFALLIDENFAAVGDFAKVEITVDSLPALVYTMDRVDGFYVVSDEEPGFWRLVAQMVAGMTVTLNLGSATGGFHQFSLSGFTETYLQACGWSGQARDYQRYLRQFR